MTYSFEYLDSYCIASVPWYEPPKLIVTKAIGAANIYSMYGLQPSARAASSSSLGTELN
jgi:hypothetical protein